MIPDPLPPPLSVQEAIDRLKEMRAESQVARDRFARCAHAAPLVVEVDLDLEAIDQAIAALSVVRGGDR